MAAEDHLKVLTVLTRPGVQTRHAS